MPLISAAPSYALDPAYLDEMPSVERVKADIQGKDDLDTRARQVGALLMLRRVVEDMAGNRRYQNQLTPDEIRIRNAYGEEGFRLKNETLATLQSTASGANSPKATWLDAQWDYENDAKEKRLILARYFSDDFLKQLGAEISAMDRKVAQSQAQIREDMGIRDSYWESLDAGGKAIFVVPVAISLGLVFLWFKRETRPIGISPKDPLELRCGYAKYKLRTFTGIVTDFKSGKSTKTEKTVTHYSDGSHDIKFKSSSSYWESFNLENREESKSYSINTPTGLENGHEVASVQASKKKKNYQLVFFDHTTGKNCPVEIASVLSPRYFVIIPLGIILFVASIFAEDNIGFMSNGPGMRGLLFAFLMIPTYIIFGHFLGERRVKRFLKKDMPVILQTIKTGNKVGERSAV